MNLSESVKTSIDSRCPYCNGGPLNGVTGVDIDDTEKEPMRPSAGDYSVCVYCGQILRFEATDSGLRMRAALQSDLDELRRGQPDAYRVLCIMSQEVRKEPCP